MIWWEKDNHGYTSDLKNAKIFSLEDTKYQLNQINSDRKFAALPINVAIKFGQSIIPKDYDFLKIIRESSEVMGNSMVELSEDEIGLLI